MNEGTRGWIDVGALEEIQVRSARVVKTPEGCIAVFRSDENEAFALEDRCPHKGGPLSQGIVHGRAVTCPLHDWVINLESGKAEGADEGSVKTIPLSLQNGRILLNLDAMSATRAA